MYTWSAGCRRDGEAEILTVACHSCKKTTQCFCVDSSEGEYGSGCFCLPCIQKEFATAENMGVPDEQPTTAAARTADAGRAE